MMGFIGEMRALHDRNEGWHNYSRLQKGGTWSNNVYVYLVAQQTSFWVFISVKFPHSPN